MAQQPVKTKPKLALDVSQVSVDDLVVDEPTFRPSIPAFQPQTMHIAGMHFQTANFKPVNIHVPRVQTMQVVEFKPLRPSTKVFMHGHILPALKRQLKDGEVCFCVTHGGAEAITGETWTNWDERPFWIASEVWMEHAIDEWIEGEYQYICDMLYDDVIEGNFPNRPDLRARPDADIVLEAWDCVVNGYPDQPFTIMVLNRDGIPVGTEVMTAGDIMNWYGISRETLVPLVVIADKLWPDDLELIENGEERYLNGYLVSKIDLDGELPVVHIEAP